VGASERPGWPLHDRDGKRRADCAAGSTGCKGRRSLPKRDPATNLLYGAGIHVCPGAPVARLELRLMMEEVLGVYGYIVLGAPRDGTSYSEGDLDRLRSSAAVVAAAIEEDGQL
jgi:hypothetical protein